MQKKNLSFNDSRVIYQSPLDKPNVGHIVSNEVDHFSMNFPKGKGKTLLGFGSTINWDIACKRQVEFLIIADHSPEVILAHIRFYRPLFLASKTPEEFLASLSGVLLEGKSLKALFLGIRNNEGPTEKGIVDLSQRLDDLVERSLISALDKEFALATVTQRPSSTNHAPFSKNGIHLEHSLTQMFAYLYDPVSISKLTRVPRLFIWPARFSFLGSKANYSHVRSMYLNDKVRFAIAELLEEKFYQAVAEHLQKCNSVVSDFYLSNIGEIHQHFSQTDLSIFKKLMNNVPMASLVWIYQTKGQTLPFRYACTKLMN